ncbi:MULTISPECIES: VOC family protein [unclassified Burkholderia]|uniref:VOC family protein n=1 Tax=unclassified Burkholderia TaxID=2613784 RepID=UPI000756C8B7|nr:MULTISPECIES: VOC family protein [unclassified Burkholderia]AOI76840.1 hypothetical protein WS54_11475 [Burkholderia sp. NRF60-BP8]KVA16318.1 hypothetical protein WS54_08260 [Burkholderia sp. NRF60-BP8]KVL12321.1 hypothetical protein WS95_25255 [Burkholderia sp. MSMB1826]
MNEAGPLCGCDHIAYATRDADATIRLLEMLGFSTVVYKQPLERFGVSISKMMSPRGDIVEIVEPASPTSSVSRLLAHASTVLYHAAFRTGTFGATREALLAAGALSVSSPATIPYPATPLHRRFHANHMYHDHLGLFEITGSD